MKLFVGTKDGRLLEVLDDLEEYELNNSLAQADLGLRIEEALKGDPEALAEFQAGPDKPVD